MRDSVVRGIDRVDPFKDFHHGLLAFDLDGVFADLGAHLGVADAGEEAEGPTEAAGSSAPLTETPTNGLSAVAAPFDTTHLRGASRRVWKRLSAIENFWETLDEIEDGAVRHLAALARERRWDVIFITSRPDSAGDSVQVQSQRWLEQKGYQLPSVFVRKGSRGKIASALSLDLVVDDNPENCLDIAMESDARAILVWRGVTGVVPASALRLGIGCVSSVAECLSVLDEADRVKRGGGRMLDTFRRLLGLGGAAVRDR